MVTILYESPASHTGDVLRRAAQMISGAAAVAIDFKFGADADAVLSKIQAYRMPQLQLPAVFFESSGNVLYGTATVLRTLARHRLDLDLLGSGIVEEGVTDSWLSAALEDVNNAVIAFSRISEKDHAMLAGNCRENVETLLNAIDTHLTSSTFLGRSSRITVADYALFAVLLNSTTQNDRFQIFGLTAQSPRPGLFRWILHLAHLPEVSAVLGSTWLAPWGYSKPQMVNQFQKRSAVIHFSTPAPTLAPVAAPPKAPVSQIVGKVVAPPPESLKQGYVFLETSVHALDRLAQTMDSTVPSLKPDCVEYQQGFVLIDSNVLEGVTHGA